MIITCYRKALSRLLNNLIFLTGYKEAFAKFSEYRIDSRGIKYDYESVMHYSVKAFSKNGKPTIRANKRGVHQLGNTELSPLDIEQTNLVYGCDSEYSSNSSLMPLSLGKVLELLFLILKRFTAEYDMIEVFIRIHILFSSSLRQHGH